MNIEKGDKMNNRNSKALLKIHEDSDFLMKRDIRRQFLEWQASSVTVAVLLSFIDIIR